MSHSQRALQIFDQEGERAMLAYVALNAALKESEAAFLDEGGAILCQFADETHVTAFLRQAEPEASVIYDFWWAPGTSTLRNGTAGRESWPPPPTAPVNILQWPNSQSAFRRAIQKLEDELTGEAWLNDGYPILSDHLSHMLAPSLRENIVQAIHEAHIPYQVIQDLDDIESQVAEKALEELPKTQRDALRQAIQSMLSEPKAGETLDHPGQAPNQQPPEVNLPPATPAAARFPLDNFYLDSNSAANGYHPEFYQRVLSEHLDEVEDADEAGIALEVDESGLKVDLKASPATDGETVMIRMRVRLVDGDRPENVLGEAIVFDYSLPLP